jgi:uncharacterized membrane protein YidH (DUF202 family)
MTIGTGRPEGSSRKEVIFVTALRERTTTEITRMPAIRSRVYEYVLGIVGVLTAAVGAWMYYVPADWFLGGLVEGWYFGMFIAAGVLLAAAFGIFARAAYVEDHGFDLPATVYPVLALAALAGAITFALILIL